MLSPEVLALKQVCKTFTPGQTPAADHVDLVLPRGCLLTLLGESGCGKTTLLRLVAGFEFPDSGEIWLNGELAAGPGRFAPPERRQVGMVFQDYALFPHLTLAGNIAFGLRQRSAPDAQRRMAEVIGLVGLSGLEQRYPHELSGGQRQRVALARALAPRPRLILMDEPLSNLDAQMRLRLRQEVRDILKAEGVSAIFVTHDQEEALSISDLMAVMSSGHIEQVGAPETVYHQPASRFVAEFVTQANFLPAQFVGGRWRTEAGEFDAADGRLDSIPEGAAGDLMICQESLELIPNEAGLAVIIDQEFLGREHRYRVQTPSGRILQARQSGAAAGTLGSRVDLWASPARLRFYPAGTDSLVPAAAREADFALR